MNGSLETLVVEIKKQDHTDSKNSDLSRASKLLNVYYARKSQNDMHI